MSLQITNSGNKNLSFENNSNNAPQPPLTLRGGSSRTEHSYWDYFTDATIPWYERAIAGALLPLAPLALLTGCGTEKIVEHVDYCQDADGDGFKDLACGLDGADDCDDDNHSIHPNAEETAYDGIDQNCDGRDLTDADGDGFESVDVGGDDCDDADPTSNPDGEEIPYDEIDQDCSGADLTDVDGDGYDAEMTGGSDCDDARLEINPNAEETPYDGIDQDCSGADLTDVDEDDYDAVEAGGDDCNDALSQVNPSATEECNTLDDDCDGSVDEDFPTRTYYYDGDNDGWGDPESAWVHCEQVENYVENGSDCDDDNNDIHPNADEICNNELDDDCNGAIDDAATTTYYEDADGDGFGISSVTTDDCELPSGYAEIDGDCDDTDANINPDEAEDSGNSDDENCNGTTDEYAVGCGAGSFTTIQDAVDAAMASSLDEPWVYICDGTYSEDYSISSLSAYLGITGDVTTILTGTASVYDMDGELIFSGLAFDDGHVRATTGGGTMTVEGCNFINGIETALHFDMSPNGNLNVSGSTFDNNDSVSADDGGAIGFYGNNLSISGSSFTYNTSIGLAAAIYVHSGDATISSSDIEVNTVTISGGAFYIENGATLSSSSSNTWGFNIDCDIKTGVDCYFTYNNAMECDADGYCD